MSYNIEYINFTKITNKVLWAAAMRKTYEYKDYSVSNLFSFTNSLPFTIKNTVSDERVKELFGECSEYECTEYDRWESPEDNPELIEAQKWYTNLSDHDKEMVDILKQHSGVYG